MIQTAGVWHLLKIRNLSDSKQISLTKRSDSTDTTFNFGSAQTPSKMLTSAAHTVHKTLQSDKSIIIYLKNTGRLYIIRLDTLKLLLLLFIK